MDRTFAAAGAISAMLAIAAGAFGAHALRTRLPPEMLAVFESAARYQMYHALGLLFVSWAATRWAGSLVNVAGWMFIAGTVVFSGSLYVLSMTGQRWMGAITPFGGVLFIVGWAVLAAGILQSRTG